MGFQPSKVGSIYYIACTSTMRLKIGFTNGDPLKRLRALQTGAPAPLTLIAVHPGTIEQERELHKKYEAQRIHGEWFEMCEELFMQIGAVVWTQARLSINRNEPVPEWVTLALRSMRETAGPLPPHLEALL